MIIIGAKGFAKEILEICHQNNETENLCFYDDVSESLPDYLFDEFPILRSEKEADDHFGNISNEFTIGIGNSHLRSKMYEKFTRIRGGALRNP